MFRPSWINRINRFVSSVANIFIVPQHNIAIRNATEVHSHKRKNTKLISSQQIGKWKHINWMWSMCFCLVLSVENDSVKQGRKTERERNERINMSQTTYTRTHVSRLWMCVNGYINADHRHQFSLYTFLLSSLLLESIMNQTLRVASISHDTCNPNEEEISQSYDLVLHIISVFILFIVSLVSASIAVVTTRVKALRINPVVINTGKFFGSGSVKGIARDVVRLPTNSFF